MFLVSLFGTNISDPGTILEMVFVTLIATLLISGVPIGGGNYFRDDDYNYAWISSSRTSKYLQW